MAYCRMSEDSDVYVIATMEGKNKVWECVGCTLTKEHYGKTAHTRTQMLTHLTHHRGVGDKVPTHAVARLQRERQEDSQ